MGMLSSAGQGEGMCGNGAAVPELQQETRDEHTGIQPFEGCHDGRYVK